MSYGQLSWIGFYSCYLQQCPTYSLIGPLAMDLWKRSVLSRSFLGTGSLVFSGISMVLRAHMVLWQSWISWKNFFCSQKWEKYPSLGFSESIWKFSYYVFFSIWSIMEVYINCCMLENFWFLKYVPKMFLANQITGPLNQLYL